VNYRNLKFTGGDIDDRKFNRDTAG